MNKEKITEKVLTAIKIRDAIRDIFEKYDVRTSYSDNEINPCYNQTDELSEGFICEYYYGSPSKIYTPLGYIRIWSGGLAGDENYDIMVKEIEETFGLVLKEAAKTTLMGVFGGWYHITKLPWTTDTLKCDCTLRNNKDCISYKEATELYKQITE